MMHAQLNPSGYKYSATFYDNNFEEILSKIIACYHIMLSETVNVRNDENSIRDKMLYDYLKKAAYKHKLGLSNYLFDSELPENHGRIDIRIMPINPFISDDAYYIIECKRLNAINQTGETGLNGEYVAEGLCRYVSGKYSTHYRTNGMIGFIVQPMDIHANVVCINTLLANTKFPTKTRQHLQYIKLADGFQYSYCSTHGVDTQNVTIYHLMFDFSNNIISS